MGYVVTAPLAIVRTTDGKMVHLYDGQPVPASAVQADVARLAADGVLSLVDNPIVAEGPEKPAGNASHDAWAAYAVATGQAAADDLKGLTRDELRELYG